MRIEQSLIKSEQKNIATLSVIISLRMIGLFMTIPMFSLYAKQLQYATPFLIGLSVGIYGLAQAVFQILFGSFSDRYGRKPLIAMGLMIFSLGSLVAGSAHTIYGMLLGRTLQGTGAVGGTLLALLTDLTQERHRTKAMAIAGITIGCSFSIALILGPILLQWIPVSGLFFITSLMGLFAIFLLLTLIPTHTPAASSTDVDYPSFLSVFMQPVLFRLNVGIFILHAIFTASFIVLPINLLHFNHLAADQQWTIYLPALLTAFFISFACIGIAERKRQVPFYFRAGILLIAIAETLLIFTPHSLWLSTINISLFFIGFSLLEAFLPSLVARTAPPSRKGIALGLYSCSQFLGIFAGGVLGGWLYGSYGFAAVYSFCIAFALIWFLISIIMK